jgi:hypothetical protein
VRLDAENDLFPLWKVWERGAPHVAVEVVSADDRPWAEKLPDYHEVGVRELVRFDPEAPPGERLRVWDRVEEDLVPRRVVGDRAASRVLGGTWCVGPGGGLDVALNLEEEHGALLPAPGERDRSERAAAAAERARADALEAQIAALLGERGSGS